MRFCHSEIKQRRIAPDVGQIGARPRGTRLAQCEVQIVEGSPTQSGHRDHLKAVGFRPTREKARRSLISCCIRLRPIDGEADVLVGPFVELALVALLQQLHEARDLAQGSWRSWEAT